MEDPHVIHIHCDGAMDYDRNQTGGNGFAIEFPDTFDIEPIHKFLRNDGQGIHRLEMISILRAMEELIYFSKIKGISLRGASGVTIYTDRMSVTDERISPYKIRTYIRNDWKTYEGKSVKNKDLLDGIYKTRLKLSKLVGGRIEIKYKPEKYNKIADKLSRLGKRSNINSRKITATKNRRVSGRKFDGPEINYSTLRNESMLDIYVYAWEVIQDQCEVNADILLGEHTGKKISIYIDLKEKKNIHRKHSYNIQIINVLTHHIKALFLGEIK